MFASIYGNKSMKIAIIGAGASGCFCAIQLKRSIPDAEVTLLEAGRKPMAKLAITGGGRCNFTNTFNGINSLSEAYPRGERLMKRLMKSFDQHSICEWFESEGIAHTVQSDECIFPASQDAMEIVNSFEGLMRRLGVKLLCSSRVTSIRKDSDGFELQLEGGSTVFCDRLIVSAGGLSKAASVKMFDELELEMVPVVPSLFTFDVDGFPFSDGHRGQGRHCSYSRDLLPSRRAIAHHSLGYERTGSIETVLIRSAFPCRKGISQSSIHQLAEYQHRRSFGMATVHSCFQRNETCHLCLSPCPQFTSVEISREQGVKKDRCKMERSVQEGPQQTRRDTHQRPLYDEWQEPFPRRIRKLRWHCLEQCKPEHSGMQKAPRALFYRRGA